MSRAERLLKLVQVLYRHRQPVSGAALADTLGVNLHTLYRDIASLQAQGPRSRASPASAMSCDRASSCRL
ncbi:TPA: HTH domain-containing protein [Klebsiella oxytoca]